MSSWRERLDRLANVCPGWIDDGNKGRWGLPADEGALRQAERFLIEMGDHADSPALHLGVDPLNGDVEMYWSERGRTIAVWAEAGCIGMIIAYHNDDPPGRWLINRDETPFEAATSIAGTWLSAIR